MSLSKIDTACATLEFIMRQRKAKADEISRKQEMSEREKIFVGQEYEWMRAATQLIEASKKNVGEMLGKLPPQAVDLEEAVLGAITLELSALGRVDGFLTVNHFYKQAHKDIYQACLDLKNEKAPVDMRTVIAQLRKYGRIEQVGGVAYIAELNAKVSQATNIEFHARVLVEMAMKRELIMLAGRVLHSAFEDTTDALVLLDQTETELNKIIEWTKK